MPLLWIKIIDKFNWEHFSLGCWIAGRFDLQHFPFFPVWALMKEKHRLMHMHVSHYARELSKQGKIHTFDICQLNPAGLFTAVLRRKNVCCPPPAKMARDSTYQSILFWQKGAYKMISSRSQVFWVWNPPIYITIQVSSIPLRPPQGSMVAHAVLQVGIMPSALALMLSKKLGIQSRWI